MTIKELKELNGADEICLEQPIAVDDTAPYPCPDDEIVDMELEEYYSGSKRGQQIPIFFDEDSLREYWEAEILNN